MAEIGGIFVKIASTFDAAGIKSADNEIKKLSPNVQDLTKQLKQVALGAAAFGAAIVYAANKAVNAASVQEKAERLLAVALENSNNIKGVTLEQLKEHASKLQKLTTVGDETSLSLMQLGLSMGINAEKISEATAQAIGLSKAYGIDLNTAMKLVALAREGEYSMLARYIPALRTATTEEEKAVIVKNAMINGFKIAQEETGTYAGKVEQLKNRWSDVVEEIGFRLMPVFEGLVEAINIYILPLMENFIGNTGKLNNSTKDIITTFKVLLTILKGVIAAFDIGAQAIVIMAAVTTQNFDLMKIAFTDFALIVDKYTKQMNMIWAEEARVIQEAENVKREEIKATFDLTQELDEQSLETKKELFEEQKELNKLISEENDKMMEEQEKEVEKKTKLIDEGANKWADSIITGARIAADSEKMTWKSTGKAFKQALQDRLSNIVAQGIQEIIANRLKSLAIAIMNASITWGVAAYQIGAVTAAAAAGIAGMRAIKSFDVPGVVPGPIGKPVVVQALGGEKYLGKESVGWGTNPINVYVTGNTILDDYQAEFLAEKIGKKIYDKIKLHRVI